MVGRWWLMRPRLAEASAKSLAQVEESSIANPQKDEKISEK
jgi:hypothetical protein